MYSVKPSREIAGEEQHTVKKSYPVWTEGMSDNVIGSRNMSHSMTHFSSPPFFLCGFV